jgi:hypothetical protein
MKGWWLSQNSFKGVVRPLRKNHKYSNIIKMRDKLGRFMKGCNLSEEENRIRLSRIPKGKNHYRYGTRKENNKWAMESSERFKRNNPMKEPKIKEKAWKTKLLKRFGKTYFENEGLKEFQFKNNLCIKKSEKWSNKEIKFLKTNLKKLPYSQISKILGRTQEAIRCKARDLGIIPLINHNYKFDENIKLCGCGCGEWIKYKRMYKYKGIPKYINGHGVNLYINKGLIKPNNPEKLMIKLIKENNLPFNYVGNGAIWFRGDNNIFNPDFLSKNPKHIIELFGDYWHNRGNSKKRDLIRLNTYAKYGYKTLVIWEHELKSPNQVIDKIKEFIK